MLTIRIRDLSKAYGEKILFDRFSLDIHTGDRIGIIGLNGSGKTTLLETIIGLVEPDKGYVETFGKIGYLAQDLGLPSEILVKDYFNFSSFDQESLKRYIREMKLREDILTSRCGILSGGEKTKLKLIEVLMGKPIILILDEPTNHLDIKGIEVLEEKLKGFYGTVIVVSHDRFFLDKTVNKILEIHRGKVGIYPGNYTDYSEKKREELERAWEEYEDYVETRRRLEESARRLKERAKSVGRVRERNDTFSRYGKDFYGRKASKVAKVGKAIERRIEKLDAKEKPFEEQHIKMGFGTEDEGVNLLVYCEDIEKSFGDKLLFKESSVSVNRGQKIALLGDNGSGKTTLLRILLGKEPVTKGKVWISELVKAGYLDQEISLLNPNNTILEEVKLSTNYDITTIRTLLGCLLFIEDDVLKRIEDLSMGEKVRVTLAKLMLGEFNLLVMDEPTNFLDIRSREVIEEALRWYRGTLIFVSHDRYFISKVANTIWEIEDKKINCYPGDYEYYVFKKDRLKDGDIKDKILLLEVQLSKISSELDKAKDSEKEELNRRFIELTREINRLKSR